MKKVSISLVALLAIIFAVGSSFTVATSGEYVFHKLIAPFADEQGVFDQAEYTSIDRSADFCGSTNSANELCAAKFRWVDEENTLDQNLEGSETVEFLYIEE